MKSAEPQRAVITGIGLVTPLGKDPQGVLRRIEAGESAATAPTGFAPSLFACPVYAQIRDFQPQEYVSEAKMVRLMNRDAQLAVAGAHLALQDAGIEVGEDYKPEEIALFGATGLVGLPLSAVEPLIKASTGPKGGFDLERFGKAGLKAVNPILSFKILSNMPLCFVSICESIQGPNGIYTPWEGQGAQAIEAGIRALECGDARCALVGGCDVKTHELAFIGLEQQGLFDSWKEAKRGVIPGEGAAFLVLEREVDAVAREARFYARLANYSLRTQRRGQSRAGVMAEVFQKLAERRAWGPAGEPISLSAVVAAGNGNPSAEADEAQALSEAQIHAPVALRAKKQTGDLFAAAAPLQVGLGALLAQRCGGRVLANCFGHGSEQAAFVLEQA